MARYRGALRRLAVLLLLIANIARAEAPSPAPFLWQVVAPSATHYLLGSVHLLPRAAEDLPTGIREAFAASDTVVFESDIAALSDRSSTTALLESAKAPGGLKSEVDAATMARVRARVADLKMPKRLCEQYRPWFCALSLELFAFQRAGFKGEYGLDRQLYEAAHKARKPIRWFESPPDHLALFSSMPAPLSRNFLDAALSERTRKDDEPVEMFRAWRDNDIDKLTQVIAELKAEFPDIHEHLLTQRNRAWLPELKRRLALSDQQLFVVGAAHWVGPDGLIASLEAAGFRVQPYDTSAPNRQAPSISPQRTAD